MKSTVIETITVLFFIFKTFFENVAVS